MSKMLTIVMMMTCGLMFISASGHAQDNKLMPSILNQKALQSVRMSLWFSGLTGNSQNLDEQDTNKGEAKHPDFLTDKHFQRLIK